MMTDSSVVKPGPALFLFAGGQRWACHAGDVLGRAGTVAPDFLRPIPVLSRRHLMIEYRDAIWYAMALPEARNETYLGGLPMLRGIPYPLTGLQSLQVDSFHFHLGPEESAAGIPDWTFPVPVSACSSIPPPAVPNETHHAQPSECHLSHLPVAMVETDDRLHILSANPHALALLGEHAVGHDIDEWAPERTRLRDSLLRLEDGKTSPPLEVALSARGRQPTVEFQACRHGPKLWIHLRDVSSRTSWQEEQEQLAKRFAAQSTLLAELSLSRAFQEGDVARSLTLLAHRAANALSCCRVSAWLKPESSGPASRKLICQVCHDTRAPAATGLPTDLAYCPMFFDVLDSAEPWATALESSPVMNLLREIGFAQPGTSALLCVALQHANGFYGVLAFEKSGDRASWNSMDREFALCLASYGVLALQSRERQDTLIKLQQSEARMKAELEEANQYIQRVLPEPISAGPITAEWHMQPSEALGGDSFGYHWVGDLFVMYVLDVVGHGTGMALLSISILNNVRARLLLGEAAMADPAGVMMDLNAAFPMENQNNMLFSMWYGVFNRRTRQLTYSSAGHPPAILLLGNAPDDQEDYLTLGTDGPAVGAMEAMVYVNAHTTIDPGAKLYLFTDGAFEIPLGPDREWTFDEFIAVVRTTRYMDSGEPTYLRKRIGALCARDCFPDDFTIIRFTFDN